MFNKQNKHNGFTLLELMIAIFIFAILTTISYRVVSELITTKEVITANHDKWGSVSDTINQLNKSFISMIPLTVRDSNGVLIPSLITTDRLNNKYAAQLELTESGFISDVIAGSVPPKRVGYRFSDNKIYKITWPVLNRLPNTIPRIDLLLNNVKNFNVKFLYPDNAWREAWPYDGNSFYALPKGIKIEITMLSKEVIVHQWAI